MGEMGEMRLRAQKRMKMVMSSSQKNTRKISKQFLFLALFSSAHHVTIMTSKKKKKKQLCFHFSKNADHITMVFAWSDLTVLCQR